MTNKVTLGMLKAQKRNVSKAVRKLKSKLGKMIALAKEIRSLNLEHTDLFHEIQTFDPYNFH